MDNVTVLSQVDLRPVRSVAELEGRRVDQQPLARQAHPQGHPRRRGCAHRGKDRRGGAGRVQSRRPPARRRAVVDLHAAEDRRRARLRHRDHVRRRHPLRARTCCARSRSARASCLSGRAYIYGLGAGGQAGVARAIEIIRNELDVTMALTGVNSIGEIDRRVDRGDVARHATGAGADASRRSRGARRMKLLFLIAIGLGIAGRAVIFVRQEFSRHRDL